MIRLGVFTSNTSTIARAYKPYERDGVVYGIVEFNTKYLSTYSGNEISGTIIHEIAHTLGFGWDKWMELFDSKGVFTGTVANIHRQSINCFIPTAFGRQPKVSKICFARPGGDKAPQKPVSACGYGSLDLA